MKNKKIIFLLSVLIVIMLALDVFLYFKSEQITKQGDTYPENLMYECRMERKRNSIAVMEQLYTFDYINKTIKNGKRQIVLIYDNYDDYLNYDMDSSFNDKNKPNDIINDDAIKTKTYVWYGEYTDSMDHLDDYIKMLKDKGYTCEAKKE